jgi:dCTP deaminase
MSILNDKEIRQLCLVPTHLVMDNGTMFIVSKIEDQYYKFSTGEKWEADDWFAAGFSIEELGEACKAEIPPRMITPFEPEQVRRLENGEKVISYGTSSMGYDVRLARKFKIFTNVFNALIDPLDMPENAYVDHEGDYVIIPPNSYILGHTIEYFKIPTDITAICVGKSTYARVGCAINLTPIEAGFEGTVVIEISNQTPLPMKVYSGMGIAQFLFLRGNECETSYASRNGKYQGQTGIQTALV